MSGAWLNYLASGIVIVWGVSHIVPTAAVVRSFGDISADSRRIITMEWVAEGLALTFVGLLTLVVTLAAGLADPVGVLVYRLSAGALIVFAFWTLIAGFRTAVVPVKLCPLVLSTAAALLIISTVI
jgi:hypothetical protein